MSIKKQVLKSKPVSKVTFKVEKEAANGAERIQLAGDFNNWNPEEGTMKGLKDGSFTLTLDLDNGREYQFRYFADGQTWFNEPHADKHVHSGIADDHNSVIVL
ncbi:MAG: isoamylase early set domain-containing protein [Bacteroidota bacterium]